MSATYAAVYSVTLPKASQVVGSFHAIQLANRCLDAIRCRVQTEQLGHRGRKDDPRYRARRVLLMGEETLDVKATERFTSLLELGNPHGEVAVAYRMNERRRDFYRASEEVEARQLLEVLMAHRLEKAMPPEIQKLGRTIRTLFDKLCNYHLARESNGPIEVLILNNLIKRINRIAMDFATSRTTALEHCSTPAS